jgi:hypothetical protein
VRNARRACSRAGAAFVLISMAENETVGFIRRPQFAQGPGVIAYRDA